MLDALSLSLSPCGLLVQPSGRDCKFASKLAASAASLTNKRAALLDIRKKGKYRQGDLQPTHINPH